MKTTKDKKRLYNKRYYANHRVEILAQVSAYAATTSGKAKRNAYQKKYYNDNQDVFIERAKANYDKLTPENKRRRQAMAKQRELASVEMTILRRTRERAKRSGIEFNLTIDDVKVPTVCPVLGILIARSSLPRRGGTDNSPSVDRIDSSKGYVKGNVHVISNRANRIKNNATPQELSRVAQYFYGLQSGLL
jgi:hypothetical protein